MACILFADDSASMRQMIRFTLEDAGYSVVEAVDGEDALDKLKGAHVDLIITDLNMPKLDGIGLVKEVRAGSTHKFLPIVILTTESQESKKQQGRDAGATGWIVKPFRPEQLVGVVKKVLN